MATKNQKWSDFINAVMAGGIMAAQIFGGRDLKQGVAIAGQSGAIDALANLITPNAEESETTASNNVISPLTDEIQAKNQLIEAQRLENEALKKQIENLTNTVNQLLVVVNQLKVITTGS